MIINKDNYSEFFKSEEDIKKVLSHSDDPTKVGQVIYFLNIYLAELVTKGDIISFSINDNRFEVHTEKYVINMLVIHSGDVCFYTINKSTNYKGNYQRKMFFRAVIDYLNNLI